MTHQLGAHSGRDRGEDVVLLERAARLWARRAREEGDVRGNGFVYPLAWLSLFDSPAREAPNRWDEGVGLSKGVGAGQCRVNLHARSGDIGIGGNSIAGAEERNSSTTALWKKASESDEQYSIEEECERGSLVPPTHVDARES